MGQEMSQIPADGLGVTQHVKHLIERRDVLILYIDQCRKKEDWHGVRDAATDIEVCLAELGAYHAMQREVGNARQTLRFASHTPAGLTEGAGAETVFRSPE